MKSALKLMLKTHGMNQAQLAEQLGVSSATVSNWSTGKVDMPTKIQRQIIELLKTKNQTDMEARQTEAHIDYASPILTNVETLTKKAKTLEGKIKECKLHCLEHYGFEIVVVKANS